MLTLWRKFPAERGGDAFTPKDVGHLLAREQSTTVHPRAKVSRHRDVRRRGDDALGKWDLLSCQLIEQRTEAKLRGHCRLDGDGQLGRHVERRCLQSACTLRGERYTVKKDLQLIRRH